MGSHTPVLLDRCLELLGPALAAPGRSGRNAIHVDATLGLGGHAEAVLAGYPRLVLIGLDRDAEALRRSGERLAGYADRTHLVGRQFCPPLDPTRPELLFRLGVRSLVGWFTVDGGGKWSTVGRGGRAGRSCWPRGTGGRWESCFSAPIRPDSTTRAG